MKNINFNMVTNTSREAVRAGRGFVVLEAVACVGDTAMNGILYPLSVVNSHHAQLENKPAPLGHPSVDGVAVNADNFFIKGSFDIGAAVLQNTMRNGEHIAEIWIDKEVAGRTTQGARLLDMIANKESIGVSTGLKPVKIRNEKGVDKNGQTYTQVLESFEYDHLAILINETPAGHSAGTYIIYNAETGTVENGDQSSLKQNEVFSMKHEFDIADLSKADRVKFQSLTVNEIMAASTAAPVAPTLEEATAIVVNSGLIVNEKDGGVFVSKEDAELIKKAKAAAKAKAEEMKTNIIANSKWTAELLADKSEIELELLCNMIEPEKDFSLNAGLTTNAASATFKAVEY